jgi:hypothetical protein
LSFLRAELPDDREAGALGIAACTQLLNVSRRVGTRLDEARALLEEGQTLANAIGDRGSGIGAPICTCRWSMAARAAVPATWLSISSWRSRTNQRAALEIDDMPVQANASLYLVDALAFDANDPLLGRNVAGKAREPLLRDLDCFRES